MLKIKDVLNTIIQGDTLAVLKTLPSERVDTIITSCPYWNLRSYLPKNHPDKPKEIGSEDTLEEYIDKLLKITKELFRVLKPTGVLWWNHGNSYNKKKCLTMQNFRLVLKMIDDQGWILRNILIWYKNNALPSSVHDRFSNIYEPVFFFVKNPKYYFDLDSIRIPLQTSSLKRMEHPLQKFGTGEQGSIMAKNTKECETVILNPNKFNYKVREAKKEHFDIVGVKVSKEEMERYDKQGRTKIPKEQAEMFRSPRARVHRTKTETKEHEKEIKGKNPGDMWTISTSPFSEAHFATFPEKLIIPMVTCSCPQEVCKKCGHIRTRITKTEQIVIKEFKDKGKAKEVLKASDSRNVLPRTRTGKETIANHKTLGWTTCKCEPQSYEPGIVLDPFMGAGTTALVAKKLGRNFIGIELSEEFIKISKKRIGYLLNQENLF